MWRKRSDHTRQVSLERSHWCVSSVGNLSANIVSSSVHADPIKSGNTKVVLASGTRPMRENAS